MIELVKKLLPYIVAHKAKVIGALFFSFLLAAVKGGQAYLVKPIFDEGLSPTSTTKDMLILSLSLVGLGLINFPARFLHFYWIRYVVDSATCSIRDRIYSKLQRLPLSFYAKKKQGALISNLLNDTLVFSNGFRGSIDLIREPVTALVMFGIALWRDWQLTLVIATAFPLFVLIFNKSGKKVRGHQGVVQEELS